MSLYLPDVQGMGGQPCPFCVKSASHPSPQESDWLDKDWDGDRQRAREQQRKANSNHATTIDITTTASQTTVNNLLDTTTALICKLFKPESDPCPFAIKPSSPPLLSGSEDCNDSKEREYRKRKELQSTGEEEGETRENNVLSDYCPTSPVYNPMFKEDPLSHLTPKERLVLDSDYYPI